jgi:hypothetical protein
MNYLMNICYSSNCINILWNDNDCIENSMCLWDLIGNFPWHCGDCCIGVDCYIMIC